jgi:hypothetical protein
MKSRRTLVSLKGHVCTGYRRPTHLDSRTRRPYESTSLPELSGKTVVVDAESAEEDLVLVLRKGTLHR